MYYWHALLWMLPVYFSLSMEKRNREIEKSFQKSFRRNLEETFGIEMHIPSMLSSKSQPFDSATALNKVAMIALCVQCNSLVGFGLYHCWFRLVRLELSQPERWWRGLCFSLLADIVLSLPIVHHHSSSLSRDLIWAVHIPTFLK